MENGITRDESKAIGEFIEKTSKLNIHVFIPTLLVYPIPMLAN